MEPTASCPWCEEAVTPLQNDGTGVSNTGEKSRSPLANWIRRNPAMCPLCGGVGSWEDFGIGA